jgi:hypothetical protein
MRRSSSPPPRTISEGAGIKRPILLFLLLSAVYHSNLRPIAGSDSFPSALVPFSLWLDGSPRLDRFGPYVRDHIPYATSVVRETAGHWYSTYPIAGPVLASPLYFPLALVPSLRHLPPETLIALARIAEKFAAVTLAALAAVALFLLLLRLAGPRAAWWLTLLYALGTNTWATTSQALWQHTFDQLPIIGFLYGLDSRRPWLLGLCVALAIAIRPTNIILLPVLLLASRRALIPVAAIGAAVAAYNWIAFHRLTGGYAAELKGSLAGGLAGLLFSPGRGLLIYTPVAIFAVAAFLPRARALREKHRPLVLGATAIVVLHTLLIACWPVWWGGYTWGPRLLSETLAPLTILMAIGLPALAARRWKPLFLTAAIYGCLIQALGVYCYPKGRWDHSPQSVDTHPERLWNWSDNPIVRTARGGLAWEPYSVVAAAVRGGIPAAAKRIQELGIGTY